MPNKKETVGADDTDGPIRQERLSFMASPIVTQSAPTEYQQRAQQTRRRRQAAGKYPTPAQKAAFTRRMTDGVAALTRDELQALASHPHLTHSQRAQYAAMAVPVLAQAATVEACPGPGVDGEGSVSHE